jgi:hypothetical protein
MPESLEIKMTDSGMTVTYTGTDDWKTSLTFNGKGRVDTTKRKRGITDSANPSTTITLDDETTLTMETNEAKLITGVANHSAGPAMYTGNISPTLATEIGAYLDPKKGELLTEGVKFVAPDTAPAAGGARKRRLMSRKYCKKTPCRKMGFTQKASCRPYKNCYRKVTRRRVRSRY